MMRAIIVDHNPETCELAREKLEQAGICVEAVACDGATALDKIRQLMPDLVLLDIILPYMDGVGLIEALREEGMSRLRIFVMTGMNSSDLMRTLNKLDISGFFLKPYDIELLVRRILTVMEPDRPLPPKPPGMISALLSRQTAQWLHRMAVPPHVKGYSYLMLAVPMVVEDPELINAMTKVVYPGIAQRYHTTAACVERNMRHAIEMAWNRCRVEEMEAIFGNTLDVNKDKPNNSEFIAMLADHIRLERMY